MKYTAGQAATATGISKATITRALKSGKISGQKDASGAWVIDPSELHRVFPPVAQETHEAVAVQRTATPDQNNEINALSRELQLLRDALNDAKEDRDRWRDMAERLAIAAPDAKPLQTGFWARIFGLK